MWSSFIPKNSLIMFLGGVLVVGASLIYLIMTYPGFTHQSTLSASGTPVSYLHLPTSTQSPSSIPAACHLKRSDFQTGVAFPRWYPMGYGESDTKWLTGLQDIRTQTGACWIEMPVLFFQTSLTSTTVTTGSSAPTLTSFTYGIRAAHERGYRVFVTPILTVGGPQAWSGAISFASYQQEQQWFDLSSHPAITVLYK